ncbi:hypothetical protein RJ639_015544 [Escallonia herrerae]|uniref:Subtilisin-like protease n=1 Tax=Escallonia herrerae TaxID=1293975 RepID=A0AA89ALR4_9ASTE|nr:hypothetical protein RJ639_015544 [Escallonia herrerae]
MDDAIGDGVHVLSLSIGTSKPTPYTQDGIAIGALHAVKKNIVVVCSAGNNGPTASTLSNQAPWIITIGASSVDRTFGQTVTPYELKRQMYPLVYAAQVVNSDVPKTYIAGQCLPGALSPQKAKGKIVLCFRGNGTRVGKGQEVKRAGGIGFILGNSPANGAELAADAHVLPATAVNSENAIKIVRYINRTKNPMASIFPAKTVLYSKPAPFMAAFTSRGPNTISPDILKVTTGLTNNMGKPITDASGNTPADPFQFGAGHFRPEKAADPGLVYDASYTDYCLFLCSSGIKTLDPSFKCPINPPSPNNLNHPSLAIPKLSGAVTVKRTVTNVGGSKSVYFASVKPPLGISVTVSPPILFFNQVGQKKSFTITVEANSEMVGANALKGTYSFGWLTWTDSIHNVRSPIAVSLA